MDVTLSIYQNQLQPAEKTTDDFQSENTGLQQTIYKQSTRISDCEDMLSTSQAECHCHLAFAVKLRDET